MARLDLAVAAWVFAACLLLSAVALFAALLHFDGIAAYASGLQGFVSGLPSYGSSRLLGVTLGVALMAIAGSDYHQFLQAARSPRHARAGGLLAALLLIALALLPPAVVVAAGQAGGAFDGAGSGEGRRVLPAMLAQAADSLWPGARWFMLASLSIAALGAGAAVLRAMREAWRAAIPSGRAPDAVCVLLAAGLAAGGQGIVDTMVTVNVVYLGSVSVCAVALLRGVPPSSSRAIVSLWAGLIGAASVQALALVRELPVDRDLAALMIGLMLSSVPVWWGRSESARRCGHGSG